MFYLGTAITPEKYFILYTERSFLDLLIGELEM